MGNRKKPPRQRRQRPAIHPGELAASGMTFGSDASFNHAVRKSCSERGAPVKWVDAEAASAHGLDVDQALQFVGARSAQEVEFWICTSCDNAGVMGGASSSF